MTETTKLEAVAERLADEALRGSTGKSVLELITDWTIDDDPDVKEEREAVMLEMTLSSPPYQLTSEVICREVNRMHTSGEKHVFTILDMETIWLRAALNELTSRFFKLTPSTPTD